MATEKINAILDDFDKLVNIPENTDLNSLTVPGFYGCKNSATAKTLSNSPTTEAFAMIVLATSFENNKTTSQVGKRQLVLSQTNLFFRGASSSSWAAWKKVEYTTVS